MLQFPREVTAMKTQSLVSDVTVRVSSEPILTLPKQVSRELGVRAGQKVSVRVRNGALRIRKNGKSVTRSRTRVKRTRRIAKLTDIVGAIPVKPGAPKINIEELMSHHGYEQFERPAPENS